MASYKTHAWIKTEWERALPDAMLVGLTGIGGMLEEQAALNSPVRTGRLEGSITYAVSSPMGNIRTSPHSAQNIPDDKVSMPNTPHTLHVGTNVEYAPFVEYGHFTRGKKRFIQGKRFLTRAFDDRKNEFAGVFITAIEQAVLKHGK